MKKAMMILSDYVEDLESLGTRDLLIRANISVDTYSYTNYNIVTSHNLEIKCDYLLSEINDIKNYDLLIIPGGPWVEKTINDDYQLIELIKKFRKDSKLICAICAAPLFLNKANILKEKEYTCFKGLEQQIDGIKKDADSVLDDNILTSRNAFSVFSFSELIISTVLGQKALIDFKKQY
ncbi:MAG: DJ-1/PfpI family protein [Acholeplasmatales bacterium]|jgi:4-methyl-5(b-hydroxyethyl)-thiazole monophosphate biosynthesis|nr:DJ-1/PfpI family protein [Acholeplasmatales bacterium]